MANWVKNKIEKASFRYLLTLGVSVFVLIVAIVFFIYTFVSVKIEENEKTGQRASFRVSQIVAQVDEKLNTFEKYYISSLEDDTVQWLLQNDYNYSDYSRYKSVMDIMSGKKMLIDYVSGYTLINFETGSVLSNKGLVKIDELINADVAEKLYDRSVQMGQKRFWNYVASDSPNAASTGKNDRITFDDRNLSLVMRLPQNSINAHAIAVIKLNMNEWREWVNKLLEEDEEVVVISGDGTVVYSTNENLNEAGISVSSSVDSGYEGYRDKKNGSYVIAMSDSAVTGWKYVVFCKNGGAPSGVSTITWVGMLLLLILIGGLLFYGANLFYKPVNNIVKNISETEEAMPLGNEFSYITNHLSGLKYDKEQLENMVNSQGARIQEMFELRLINESIKSEDDWNDYFGGLHLPTYSYFATAVMVLDLSNEQEIQTSLSEDAICLKIVDIMPENIKSLLWMTPVYNSCAIFCLFGADNENDLLAKICDFHAQIQEFTYKETGYRLIMGVSNTCTEHRGIRRAYRESISALTNMAQKEINPEGTEGQVPECRFFISTESDKGEPYSNSFENEIQTAIKAVDKEKAYDVTNRFARHLNTVISTDIATLYIIRYVNSIMLTAIESGINIKDITPEGIQASYRELISAVEPARVRRYIKMTFIDPIIAAISERMKDDSYNIMGSIEQLVEESKGDILLAECAEKLGVHQTHIWKILKMEKGLSFTEYTEKYKIEEAKKLLLQTNMTVQEIAAALNYSNAQNFIRFFSKVTGVTPGKFRKLY